MVVILQVYKFLMNLFDVRHSAPRKRICQLTITCYFVVQIPFLLSPLNSQNMIQIAESLEPSIGFTISFFIVTHILTNRGRFDALENELQALVYQSECQFKLK